MLSRLAFCSSAGLVSFLFCPVQLPGADGDLQPACAQSCPTSAIIFGDWKDQNSRISKLAKGTRAYHMLDQLGTEPTIVYLKKVDPNLSEHEANANASSPATAAYRPLPVING